MIAISLPFALLVFSASAVPLVAREGEWSSKYPDRYDTCPSGFDQFRVHGACTSGFVGCAHASDAETCAGKERFVKKCARPEYGEYYECPNNGFRGCTTNPDVCSLPGTDWVPVPPVPGVERPDLCPAGMEYRGADKCKSGFVGCLKAADEDSYCGGPTIKGQDTRRYWATCHAYGKYRTCDNGFYGCSTEDACAKAPAIEKKPNTPAPPKSDTKPPKSTPPTNSESPYCPAGTKYYMRGACASSFVGCGTESVCSGPRLYWGDCPAGTGSFYVCGANGFTGCTTRYPC